MLRLRDPIKYFSFFLAANAAVVAGAAFDIGGGWWQLALAIVGGCLAGGRLGNALSKLRPNMIFSNSKRFNRQWHARVFFVIAGFLCCLVILHW